MNPNNKKFISMFILFISLFVFVFFTQNIYSEYIDKKETNEKLSLEYKNKLEKMSKLDAKSKELKDSKSDKGLNSEIKKYLQTYSEDRIINLFYNFAEEYNNNGQIIIKWLSFSKPKINEAGFKEADINLTIRVTNKKVMLDLINFIIKNPEYKFFMSSLRFPKETELPFNAQLPIKIYFQDFKKIEKQK